MVYVPFLYVGLDGLHTARIVLAVWGAGLVLASFCFLRRFARCPVWLQLAVLSLIAISTVRAATRWISPEVPLFTVLMAYCAVVASPKVLEQKRLQVLCGLLGGVAYLAKAYALPFFLVHFTFSIALHWWTRRNRPSVRSTILNWAAGVLAFSVVSAPWIGVLSWKYQRPTFSTVTWAARNLVGPQEVANSRKWGMYHLEPGRVCVCETPELTYSGVDWSPFESLAYAKHQILLIAQHSKEILEDIRSFDALGICVPTLIFLPIVLWKPGSNRGLFKSVWVLGTVAIYCSGFMLVYYEIRYIEYFLWPLCCIYCLGFFVPSFAKCAVKLRLRRWGALLAAALVAASFAEHVRERDVSFLMDCTAPRGASYRMLAQELRAGGMRGPFATDEQHWYFGEFVAFFLNEPFVGSPVEKSDDEIDMGTPIEMTVPEIEAKLEDYGVQVFVIHSDWRLRTCSGRKRRGG